MATDGLRGKFVPGSSRASLVEKLSTLLLLFILLAAAVAGMASVLTGQDWGSLLRAALFGMVLGWGLAFFRQPAWHAAWIAVTFGLIYILLFPGGLYGKAIDVLVEAVRLIPSSLAFFRGEAIELDSLELLLRDFSASAGIIAQRLQTWMTALVNGQPVFDPVAAALVWSIFIWIVAAWAGWILEAQRNVLLAALPVVLLSVGTLAYGRRTSFVLYLMMGSLLLLLALVQQGQREQLWDETGVAYPARKGRQVIRAASLATVALVLFSAFASSLSLHRLQEWISDHTKPAAQQDNGNFGESLGIITSSTGAPDLFETVRSPGLPRDHLIGSGPDLSQRTVMTVAVKDLPSLSPGGQPLPLYWRSLTYDTYTRNGWQTSKTKPESYDAGQPLQENRSRDHISIQQDVSPVEDLGGTVYAAGEPVIVNHSTEAAWRSSGDLFGIQLEQSVSYHALSLIPLVDERSLRAAGQEYPEWIRRRYLALPADLPDRVKALAIELTASEPTPYDRARAIEHYLRGFPYTLDVSRPPLKSRCGRLLSV